ncbi:MAG TPA: hypothetical protein VL371_19640 [Gemmataceae bacterium]|nr:hypothetical protein [Gemmataceae bacterium]
MMATRTDVWAEAGIRQPGGPSYEFFRDLLPPLRWANTEFRHYPIILSAPGAAVKARYISNGSAINPRANKLPMWYDPEFGVEFFVGDKQEPYGADLERLDGPRYLDGWVPVVQTAYRVGEATIEQEVFGSVMDTERGSVLVQFKARGAPTTIIARLRSERPLTLAAGQVLDDAQGVVCRAESPWKWDNMRKELSAPLKSGESSSLEIATQSMHPRAKAWFRFGYPKERSAVIDRWKQTLETDGPHGPASSFEIPEPLVQNAWRSLIVGNYLVAVGDRMHYSAGNRYDHLYEAECGDTVRALMLFGHTADARRMVGPLLDFNRQVTRYHVAGHKLQLLAHYYWGTRDAAYLKEKEPVWAPVIDFIVNSRKTSNGLLPPDRYAGDIDKHVYSLSSNSNCWRGLRDMAAVLADMGERDRAAKLAEEAKAYRAALLEAVAKSERKDVTPPFLPISLYGDDPPFDPLTATRLGSYYDLMAPYVLGSNLLAGTERETSLIEYLRQHGGLAMGMIRSTPVQGEFANEPGVNVLYGLRYMQTILRRDDVPHALAGFYGQLAQAMTRDTFMGGEGSRFFHGDKYGRSFYLPPNTTSNAMFLQTLRYLLIQDWEDADGRPHELRLLYGAPGRWFAEGAALKFERAPTMFGPVSVRCQSRLKQGEVAVEIDAPPRPPAKTSLRVPLPPGWNVAGATLAGKAIPVGVNGAIDLTGQRGQLSLSVKVKAAAP